MEMTGSKSKDSRAMGVDLWTIRGAWFWQLAGRCRGGGAIGAASTKSEALREAYAAVEEASARCARLASPNLSEGASDSTKKTQTETGDC